MIHIIYDSRTGLGKKFAKKLSDTAQPIEQGIDGPCLLITRNVGLGMIPKSTHAFLKQHAGQVIGVIVNGSQKFGRFYCAAGPKIADQYGITIVRNIEGEGNVDDVRAVEAYLQALMK